MSQRLLKPDNVKAVPYAFSQQNGYPLNANEIFGNIDDAQEFAKGAGSYEGQKITVVSENSPYTVTHYSIENNTLVEFGKGGSSDLIKYGTGKEKAEDVTETANSVKIWTDTSGNLHIDIA